MLYNQLVHIKEAQFRNMWKVPALLEVLRQYELGDVIGVNRLHRHFDLKEGEQVLWSFNKENRFASEVSHEQGSPLCLMFTGKEWQPTEFYNGTDIWETLRHREDFSDWTNKIQEIIGSDQNTYGLVLRLSPGSDMEETNEQQRTQYIEAKQDKVYNGEVITNYWLDGPNRECSGHSRNCYSYCSRPSY